jgi:ribonuclease HI
LYSVRPDLFDQPFPDPDHTLFMDGSSSVQEGIRQAGEAVVSLIQTLWVEPLPPSTSAQLAELITLTKALQLSQGKIANFYIDSKYAFWVLHAHSVLWKERGLLTTTGSLIQHSQAIFDLLEAALLSKQVAVIHCPGHQRSVDEMPKNLMFKPSFYGNNPFYPHFPIRGPHSPQY